MSVAPLRIADFMGQASPSGSGGGGLALEIERHLRLYFAAHEHGRLPAAGLYGRILREVERPLLAVTMEKCDGNQLRAAALLGLNRNTLRKKLKELGLVETEKKANARKASR